MKTFTLHIRGKMTKGGGKEQRRGRRRGDGGKEEGMVKHGRMKEGKAYRREQCVSLVISTSKLKILRI